MNHYGIATDVDWSNPVNWDAPLCRGLIAWFIAVPGRMGYGTTTWRNLVDRNDGTLQNMSATTDWVGPNGRSGAFGALDFDGVDDRVDVPHKSLLNPADITVSCWFKLTGTPTNFDGLIGKVESGSWHNGYGLFYNLNTLGFFYGEGTVPDPWEQGASVSFSGTDRDWHHVIGSGNGSSRDMWLDGSAGTSNSTSFNDVTNTGDIEIGRLLSSTGGGNDFTATAQINDIIIHDRLFDSSDAQELREESNAFYPTMLNRRRRSVFGRQPTILPLMNHYMAS